MGATLATDNLRGATTAAALMYHGVAPDGTDVQDPQYTLTQRAFERQLQLIGSDAGGACCARDWLQGLRRESVLLTFDDGKASDHEVVLPLLLKHGMTADFFVNPATVGRPGFVSWRALSEMSAAGMSIQSHGYDHVYLTHLDPPALRRNLYSARVEIEDQAGHVGDAARASGGRMPPRLADQARQSGYTHVLCSKPGVVAATDGRAPLPRLAITATLGEQVFRRWITGNARAIAAARLRYGILAIAKRTMGDARYERLRVSAIGNPD